MAGIAQKEGISGARVYQVMNFLKMPEDIQTYLRNIDDYREAQYLNEKRLRYLLRLDSDKEKAEAFRAVVSQLGRKGPDWRKLRR